MRFFAIAVLGALAAPAWGQTIDRLQNLNQQQFRLLSEDLGGGLSYRPMIPTEPLGITGFDIGIGVTAARIANEEILELATSEDVPGTLPLATLRAHKGLPWGFDIGALYAQIPGTDIKYYGGELKYAFVSGNLAIPALGVRAAFTKVSGIEQLDFNTRSVDVSLSKGFAVLTPYAGVGRVWVASDPKGTGGLSKETFGLTKVFLGIGMNFALLNFNLEADKTGEVSAVSAKLGLRF